MTRPLEGLLVVSIEQAVAAPMCTLRLADAGARVIKVEHPRGETARHYDTAVKGTSAYFAWLNRGKQSIVLDLKSDEGQALLARMVARADVFVQNLAPGAAARLGFGSSNLVERHPRLIAVDIVGYGQDTAYSQMKAYDMLIQAESAICAVTGTEEVPSKVGVSICDIATGMNAHAAILEALIDRAKTGTGRAIEMAMFDAMADWMSVPLLHYEHLGRVTPRLGLAHASIYPYCVYDCADSQIVVSVQNPDEWRRFCAGVLLKPELVEDPRFHDNPSRVANKPELDAIIAEVFAPLPRAEVVARSNAAGTVYSNVSSLADLSKHPALRRITVQVPGGAFESVAPPLRPELSPGPVPALGEHTDRIRQEFST